ncbi:MAG: DUF3352 domain-containing protein [Chloroflexota bacterium]|nr:DUF3352 domain-containing protein [Chloroflexota bacterium]
MDNEKLPPADPTVAWTPPPSDTVEEVTPPPTMRVEPTRSGGSPVRWAIALVVSALVIAVALAGVVLVTGQAAPSRLTGYVPAGSVAYGELRLDLPGDQRQKLGTFLSKFPGFQDQSILDAKLDELLDRTVRGLTQGQQDYSTKIKPWFGGELGFSVGQLPDAAASGGPSAVRALLIVSVTDGAKARAWFDSVDKDLATTTDSYKGVDLILAGAGTMKAAFAIDGKVMLVGDEASVKAAIDSSGAGSFASDARFRTATASVAGDSIGWFYLDSGRYFDWLATQAGKTPGLGLGVTVDEAYRSRIPDWMFFRLQARGDGLAFESVVPAAAAPIKQDNRLSAIAPHLPPSTILVAEGRDVGAIALQTLDLYRKNAATAQAFKQVDQTASLVGGFDAILGWMKDGSVVVTRNGTTIDAGLVFISSDRAAGERLLTTLRSFAVLGGGQSGITVRDEAHGDVTITVVDFGDLRARGINPGIPGYPLTGHLEIAFASTADLVVVGVGDTFVKSVLDTAAGSSLADDGRYKALLDRVGPSNVGSSYVNLTAARELLERLGVDSPTQMATYVRDIKPYLLPLDAFVQASVIDGDLYRTTGVLVVK